MRTLRPYQEIGRDWLKRTSHGILGDEMRLGKTPQAIRASAESNDRSVLVVSPAIGVSHWRDEWAAWAPEHDVHLETTSFEKLVMYPDRFAGEWDRVIVDEAHFARNPEALRTKRIFGKGGLIHRTPSLWCLSGTPVVKHVGELWPLLFALGKVKMGYNDFINHFCYFLYNGRVRETLPMGTKTKHVPYIRELLADVMLRRKRKEVAPDMPDIQFNMFSVGDKAPVDLPESCMEWILHPDDADQENRIEVAKAKAGPLAEHVQECLLSALYKQTVIFGWHREPIDYMAQLFDAMGISYGIINGSTSPTQRKLLQEAFKCGTIEVMMGNILSAGTTVDWSVANHGYFLELDFLPSNNLQAANRLISMMKDAPVTFDVCTWPGSFDDKMQRVLVRRAGELNQLL